MKTKLATTAFALCLFLLAAQAYHRPLAPAVLKDKAKEEKARLAAAAINNLEYDFAQAAIRPAYYPELDQLAKTIIAEEYALALRGHADSIGNYVANWKLSEKRAVAVKAYLVAQGVKEERIVTTPYGSTLPVADNKTPQGRQKNRRVEVKLKETN